MAGRPDTGIREIGLGRRAFMPAGGRRAPQDEVRASVVAMKRVTIVERRERRKMEGSRTERQKTNRCKCPRGLCRSGTDRAHMTRQVLPNGRLPWRPCEERALSRGDPIDRKAGCGKSARPFWREGWRNRAIPTPIREVIFPGDCPDETLPSPRGGSGNGRCLGGIERGFAVDRFLLKRFAGEFAGDSQHLSWRIRR